MTDSIFTEADMQKATEYPTLSPTYFAGRRIAERLIASFEDEWFKPLIEKFGKQFEDALWSSVSCSLMADTESNLTTQMHRMVDDCVRAILANEKWAIDRYVLGERYQCDKVREAVAALVPRELQDKRVADLEEEVKRLREQLRFHRS